jgi:hypothetical protein
MQRFGQRSKFGRHPHVPFRQTSFERVQRVPQLPQLPQLLVSDKVSRHDPLQHSRPGRVQFGPCAPVMAAVAQVPSVQVAVWQAPGVQAPQFRVMPHPSGHVPHVLPRLAHVAAVQPQTLAVPPPPQVWGAVQPPQSRVVQHPSAYLQ